MTGGLKNLYRVLVRWKTSSYLRLAIMLMRRKLFFVNLLMKLGNSLKKSDIRDFGLGYRNQQKREGLLKKIKTLETKKAENEGTLPVVSDCVLLHPDLNISVKRTRPVEEGTVVIVAWDGSPFGESFGSTYETTATVVGSEFAMDHYGKPTKKILLFVYKKTGNRTAAYADHVVAYEDYLDYLKEKGKAPEPVPMYKPDQVLYVKPHPKHKPGNDYPSIGSEFETDVKVIDVDISEFGSVITYRCYTPNEGYVQFREDNLTTAAERLKYIHKDFKEATVKIDAEPFFKKNETVKIFDGWVHSMDEEVIVKLNNELEKILIL